MKWLTDLIGKIDSHFSKDENKIIYNLTKKIEYLESENEDYEIENEDLVETIEELTIHNEELEAELNNPKPSTKLIPTSVKYKWRPGETILLRKSLNNFSKDETYLQKYTEFIQSLNLKTTYSNSDKLVYALVLKTYDYVNDGDNYDTDQESFGSSEYWLTPQDAYDYYINGNEGDCEDMSAFMYGCLISGLKLYGFEDELGKLKRADIRKPVGHAILIWLNEKNMWKRIESTYYPTDFGKKWRDESDFFKSVYTIVWHVFDENTEYRIG